MRAGAARARSTRGLEGGEARAADNHSTHRPAVSEARQRPTARDGSAATTVVEMGALDGVGSHGPALGAIGRHAGAPCS